MTDFVVHGTVEPGFEGVRAAFEANFREHGDKGASVGVYVGGEQKVDLWGGVADVATGRAWQRDTVSIMYSVTKGATATLAWLLAQRGDLDFDAPVAKYWPEFAGGGKASVPVRYLFTHRVGLPYLDQQLTREEVLDGARVTEVLEEQAPLWEPGIAHGYHAVTFGWLAGALIARVTGRRLGEVFADEIAGPLGLDFHIGMPATEFGRVAQLLDIPPPDPAAFAGITDPAVIETILAVRAAMLDPQSNFSRALSTNGVLPAFDASSWNDPAVYRAEIPAANGISNGQSLARMYAATVSEVDGVRLLTDETARKASTEQVSGPDLTLLAPTRFGTGFQLPTPNLPMLSAESFGHSGLGGALGFADLQYEVGFGYVQNQLLSTLAADPRTQGLIAAVADAVGAPPPLN
jgi:CubicO group peptidase (beta-lactamase class C family)